MRALLSSSFAVVALGACPDPVPVDSPDTGTPAIEQSDTDRGALVYSSPLADGNSFSCATCHALEEPAADGLRRPGHPIGSAAGRPHFKNGAVDSLLAAVNSCKTEWMNASTWSATDSDWLDLEALLQPVDGANVAALEFAIAQPPADLTGGDAEAGNTLFNGSCIVCHGRDGAGTLQGPPITGFGLDPDYVAQRVRTSGRADSAVYDELTGGIMPFWAADRLSDDELRDLIAYLAIEDAPTDTGTPEPTETGDTGVPVTEVPPCASADHDRVGWTADLQTLFHGVTGTAEIVDDCSAVITGFGYDGTGIDVRIYGAEDANFNAGFAMTDDLLKPGGYTDDVLVATLPLGRTWDDVDAVSVWCVTVGIDFGSGWFMP